jgi:myo-inositol catabolism protein IolS
VLDGGNFIDTATFYGLGRSEELIGEVIQELGVRDQVVLATKGSFVVEKGYIYHDNSVSYILELIEASLARLQTDYLDLFYIHFPDEDTPKDQIVDALSQLKRKGIIRAIGVSNFSLSQLKEANKDGHIDVVQDRYHLLNRSLEGEYIDYLVAHKIGFIPYTPLASGLLTGKYSLDTKLSERQLDNPLFSIKNYAHNLKKIEVLKKIADTHHVHVSQVSLAWLLTREFVSAIIPGAKSVEQMLENNKSAQVILSAEEIQLIDHTFNQPINL